MPYKPFLPARVILNRNSDTEDDVRLRSFYGANKYERLVTLKNRYDPTNVFRVHHNIKPTQ